MFMDGKTSYNKEVIFPKKVYKFNKCQSKFQMIKGEAKGKKSRCIDNLSVNFKTFRRNCWQVPSLPWHKKGFHKQKMKL